MPLKHLLLFLLFTEVIKKAKTGSHDDWSYGGLKGPRNWCRIGYNECCDHFQSPINVDTKQLAPIDNYLHLIRQKNKLINAKLSNDGHTVKLTFPMWNVPVLKCDKGHSEFLLDSIHFHCNSEHTINGKRFPLEAHHVYYNAKYPSVNEATTGSNGINVISTIFEVTRTDNVQLKNLVDSLWNVRNPSQIHQLKKPFVVYDLFPNLEEHRMYFTYNGSLTTPPCSHITWIIMSTPIPIGIKQLKEFHRLHWRGMDSYSNYRPLQNSFNRPVYFSELSKSDFI